MAWRDPGGTVLLALFLCLSIPQATDAATTCTIGTYATGIVQGSGAFRITGYHDDYLYKLEFLDGNGAISSTVGGSGGSPETLTIATASIEYVTEVRHPAANGFLFC